VKDLSKSEKILIALLLIVLVGYVYYQYIITPITIKVQSAQSSVDKYEQELFQTKLMAASNKKMTEEMAALKADYDKYVKQMPKSHRSAEIIREINRLAADTKVTLIGLTFGNGAEYKAPTNSANVNSADNSVAAAGTAQKAETQASIVKIMEVPVSVNIKGDYSSFTAFINSLETGSRIANISSVNVVKETDKGDRQLAVTLNISFLYVQDGTAFENNYDFNNGNYSKVDPFK
jgi:Tfp pilus assembly protein PilO